MSEAALLRNVRSQHVDHICLVWFGKEEVLYMPDLHLIMHISRCHFGEKKFCVITLVFPNPPALRVQYSWEWGGNNVEERVHFFCDRV